MTLVYSGKAWKAPCGSAAKFSASTFYPLLFLTQLQVDVTSLILPEKFSRRVSAAIAAGQLVAEDRSAFVRECVDFLEPILPTPSKEQFNEISRRLCDKYPSLKDAKKTVYWVSVHKLFLAECNCACNIAHRLPLKASSPSDIVIIGGEPQLQHLTKLIYQILGNRQNRHQLIMTMILKNTMKM